MSFMLAAPVWAHHGFGRFDPTKDVTIEGTLTGIDFVNPHAYLYFDAQTGLLQRILAITQTLLAPIPEQTDFEDYREVDGVRLPFIIRQSFVDPWVGWTRKFTEIKHNVAVDDAKFNPPPPAPSPAALPK